MTDWVGQMLGLDAETFCKNGVIQTTASEAALVAAVAARERAIRMTLARPAFRGKSRGDILPQLVMYGSTQTHSLGAKAGLILGLPFRSIETYAEDNWALTGASVKAAFEADSAKGYIPFMISTPVAVVEGASLKLTHPLLVATVGTTSSGAVDNISEVCDTGECTLGVVETLSDVAVVKLFPSVFVHVDAAWAGVCKSRSPMPRGN